VRGRKKQRWSVCDVGCRTETKSRRRGVDWIKRIDLEVEFAAPFAHASTRVYRSNRRALQFWCL
jgi:hypothetical protein